MTHDPLAVPERRRDALGCVWQRLNEAQRPLLTTHVNADGDGAGSEIALAAWLADRGKKPVIVNPTPFPDRYRFLLGDEGWLAEPGDDGGQAAMRDADLLVVLDTGEPSRIGKVARVARDRDVVVVDHHPASADGFVTVAGVVDPTACATGELLHDLFRHVGDPATAWPRPTLDGLYAAIVTDTGSFRFANTDERAHAIAGELVAAGVDPEAMYRHLYGAVPLRRIEILKIALDNLEVDRDAHLAWITIPRSVTTDLLTDPDDLDGVIDYARAIEGTEVALVFRETVEGGTKVSFRSNGAVDVNAIATEFGGGGHVKASGALLGMPPQEARPKVLERVREAVRTLETAAGDG